MTGPTTPGSGRRSSGQARPRRGGRRRRPTDWPPGQCPEADRVTEGREPRRRAAGTGGGNAPGATPPRPAATHGGGDPAGDRRASPGVATPGGGVARAGPSPAPVDRGGSGGARGAVRRAARAAHAAAGAAPRHGARRAEHTGIQAVLQAAGLLDAPAPHRRGPEERPPAEVETLPWVAHAVVLRHWPDSVTIIVTERVLSAPWPGPAGAWRWSTPRARAWPGRRRSHPGSCSWRR